MAEMKTYTPAGYKALQDELADLKARFIEVKEEIAKARSYGDLSENSEYDEAKNEEAKINLRILELEDMIAKKGERVGLAEAKKHMAWYTKGMRGSADMRSKIMNATSPDELVGFLNALRGQL